jgi:MoaA/NifB/PqqE/SkfB family radical SAM enzyme
MYHIDRLKAWSDGETVYPIYMEISPSGACNHRCRFCALDFMGYTRRFLKLDRMRMLFQELATLGVKSVMFGGEGEPMLHPEFKEMVRAAATAGLDIGITTNASLLTPAIADEIIPCVNWIKASVDAGTQATYGKLHGVKPGVFETVIQNMEYCNEIRLHHDVTLGVQMLWLPENRDEVELLADIAKEIGMDYLVVKPYSQHPKSLTNRYADVNYEGWEKTDGDFVIYRDRAMAKWDDKQRFYESCLGLPFWAYLDSGGTVWGCSAHIEEDGFRYGNIYNLTFNQIWEKHITSFPAKSCRVNCRMDECNRYLWELKNPPKHVNFL